MIIHSIKLNNYGRHKNLNLDNLNAPIIGIVGANGNGKSTILKAIAFAFKGKEDDSAIVDSISLGEDSGSIEIVFEKNETKGKIIRKFGKKDSAYLEWDGTSFTKKTDINKKIDDILGVDKQVLSNTIFIKQGEILEIVESTPAKRVELFCKLLNLDFFNKRYNVINGQYKELKDSVKDVQVLKDSITNLEEELNRLTTDITNRQTDFNNKFISEQFINKLKEKFESYKYIQQSLQQNITQLQNYPDKNVLENNITTHKAKVDNIKAEMDTITGLVESSNLRLKTLNDKIKDCTLVNNFISNYKKVFKSYKNSHLLTQELDSLKSKKDTFLKYKNYFKVFQDSLIKYNTYNAEQKDLSEQCISLNQKLHTLGEELTVLSNTLEQNKSFLQLKTKIKDKIENSKCPICGLELVLGQKITQQELDILKGLISSLETTILDKNQTKEKLKVSLDAFNQFDFVNKMNIQRSFDQYIEAYKYILCNDKVNKDIDIKSFDDKIAELTYQLTANKNLIKDYTESFSQICLNFDKLNIKSVDIESLNDERDVLVKKCDDLYRKLVKAQDDKEEESKKLFYATEVYNIYLNLENYINLDTEKIRKLDLAQDISKLESHLNKTVSLNTLEDIINQYKEDSYELMKKIANKDFLSANLNNTKVMLESKQESNLEIFNKMDNLNDLGEIMNIKNNNSLPKAYINYLFTNIVNLVKENLSMMESDFVIEIDDEEEVAIKFKRLNEMDKPWLKMQRLSGGQKVRLSIALLIAIQKLICPDLGFLVLDEPSTHLDNNSVDALADMLSAMQRIIKTSKSQIWFVDHNTALERCCSKIINI